uniref:Uncharacterized protein n=1 Tax=Cacopsylla melanoneura TaxID=428564 RepID=A0A8D8Z9J2_9HEMI
MLPIRKEKSENIGTSNFIQKGQKGGFFPKEVNTLDKPLMSIFDLSESSLIRASIRSLFTFLDFLFLFVCFWDFVGFYYYYSNILVIFVSLCGIRLDRFDGKNISKRVICLGSF